MDLTRFQAMVTRLERVAEAAPRRYTLTVGLLAAAGYLYVILLLVLIGGGFLLVGKWIFTGYANAGTLKLEFALGVLGFMLIRALWVRLEPPTGLELTPETAPRLMAAVEDVRHRLDAPTFHHTLLTDDFNASVVQIPRLGILGWQRNYLSIGLPLLEALSPEQFRAVLAHEFGHLSGNHSRFSGWIYRVRQTWAQLLAQLEQADSLLGRILVTPFVKWYVPYFNAYSFVLARSNEYEADRMAAELHGREVIGSALGRIEVVARFHGERYLPALHGRARREPSPSSGPLGGFRMSLRGLGPEEARRWYSTARQRLTDVADTHPALSDRLTALGIPPDSVDPHPDIPVTAAERFLGEDAGAFAASLDERWREAVAVPWQMQYEQLQAHERRLAELEAQASNGELEPGLQWERIKLLAELQEEARATEEARALLDREPAHASAHFYLGRTLIGQGDAEGVLHLKAAMASAPDAKLPAAELLFAYHWNRGERNLAEGYRRMLEQRSQAMEAAALERKQLKRPVLLSPPEFPEEAMASLRAALREHPEIPEAYVVRREVLLLPEEPCHLVGLRLRRPWWKWTNERADAALLQQVIDTVPTPRETYWVLLQGHHKWLRKYMRTVPGSDLLAPREAPPAPAPALSPAERQREVERRLAALRRWHRLPLVALIVLFLVLIALLLSL